MAEENVLPFNKSTNVRSHSRKLINLSAETLSRLSPWLASRIAMALFTCPHPRRKSPDSAHWSAEATPFQMEIDGRRLAAWSWGDGPTVLLQHGWTGCGYQFSAFVQPLLSAGFSVITYDAPAHGVSSGHQTNLIEMSRTIAAISHKMFGLHAIIAHSLGCAATALAHRHTLPVSRLVFLSPPADMVYFARRFTRKLGFSLEVHELMVRGFEERFGFDWDGFCAENLAKGQTTPLLIVHDHQDNQVPWHHGQRFHQAWQNSQLLSTSGLGHRFICTDTKVIQRVTEFLNVEQGQP